MSVVLGSFFFILFLVVLLVVFGLETLGRGLGVALSLVLVATLPMVAMTKTTRFPVQFLRLKKSLYRLVEFGRAVTKRRQAYRERSNMPWSRLENHSTRLAPLFAFIHSRDVIWCSSKWPKPWPFKSMPVVSLS